MISSTGLETWCIILDSNLSPFFSTTPQRNKALPSFLHQMVQRSLHSTLNFLVLFCNLFANNRYCLHSLWLDVLWRLPLKLQPQYPKPTVAMAALVAMPRIRMKITVFPDAFPPFLCRSYRPKKVSVFHRRRSFSVSASSTKETQDQIRVRFAPSPTGNLHVGGARTALFNYLFARYVFVWVYGLSRLFLYWMSMSMSISVCAGAGPMEGNLFWELKTLIWRGLLKNLRRLC